MDEGKVLFNPIVARGVPRVKIKKLVPAKAGADISVNRLYWGMHRRYGDPYASKGG